MRFLQYLLQKNFLTTKQAFEALAHQEEQLPSLFRLAHLHLKLSEETLVEIGSRLGNRDFVAAVRHEDLLSEKEIHQLLQLRNQKRIPLGEVLLTLNLLSREQLKDITFEFSSLVTQETTDKLIEVKTEVKETPQPPPESLGEQNPPPPAASEKILLPEFQFRTIDEDLIAELCQLYDERKKTQLETEILKWPSGLNKEALREFYRELHTLKGTARFLGALVIEFLIHHMENLLSDITRVADLLDEPLRKQAEELYLKGFDLAWELRNTIAEQGSEESFCTEKSKKELEDYINSLVKLQANCLLIESQGGLESFKDQF
ncbi:MAG: Hpt domain-containing protein [Pseudobdellovibrionaceae bacterium]